MAKNARIQSKDFRINCIFKIPGQDRFQALNFFLFIDFKIFAAESNGNTKDLFLKDCERRG